MEKISNTTSSLSEVNASVDVGSSLRPRKKLLAFLGPAYLISVGYMDPGNWATDLAGGSQFGYQLIWVLLMSNLIALLLQSLSARLGLVRRRDLAQASREFYPPLVNGSFYILAEIAIAATDLAEVLGMAIGLQLLTGLPLMWGVVISVADTFILLFLMNFGIRKLEAFIIGLIAIIGTSFLIELLLAKPDMGEIVKGFVPGIPNDTALYIAIGIIGATVMPHNLYLHSSLVQTRKFFQSPPEIKKAIRYNNIDSAIALNMAFFVNAAILILAASVFFKNGLFEVAEIQDAHKLLQPMLGTKWAPVLFAIALIAAGQSSTITGTLAGQVVMEGYLNLRIRPWLRRLLTRLLAIIPALLTLHFFGESSTGKLLVLSQVVLSLQLGFAIIPLIHFVSDKKKMGEFAIGPFVKAIAWISAFIIVGLNAKLVVGQIIDWRAGTELPSSVLNYVIIPIAILSLVLLIYTMLLPLFKRDHSDKPAAVGKDLDIGLFEGKSGSSYKRIAIAVDFSNADRKTILQAVRFSGHSADYLLIHVLESPTSRVFGNETLDFESQTDMDGLKRYEQQLVEKGYKVTAVLAFGNPATAITEKAAGFGADLMVMGAHGHKGLKDLIFGTTINSVRHKLDIPVMIVK
ncbi:MAG TPA: Nramp family divalent metal transporter [Bacteroidia bacterium]|nr:Nramp family divalent metal transporter [Bacteroidia bacterium]